MAEELLWFIKGCTDGDELTKKDIHIWDANGSKEFLEKQSNYIFVEESFYMFSATCMSASQ